MTTSRAAPVPRSLESHSQEFIAALERRDLAALRRVPKTDLHNHCSLGGSPEYVAERTGVVVPPLDRVLRSMQEMQEWVDRHAGTLLADPARRGVLIEACFQQARADGVAVLEVGEDVWANGHYHGGDIDALIALYEGAHRAVAPEIDFRFQVGLSRHCPVDLLREWMAPFLERDCFSALDLYCDELAQPIRVFKPLYREAKRKGLRLKAHVGEWGDADSVREAVEELELDEVQHGISAAQSPAIMRWLADHAIQLNVCPSSNVMLGRVSDLAHHPIRVLHDHGVRVTINSDDVLVFGQGVSQEYLSLHDAGLLSAAELDAIRRNGLESRTREAS